MPTVESFELGYISLEYDRGNRNVRTKDEEPRRKENPVKREKPTWTFAALGPRPGLIEGVIHRYKKSLFTIHNVVTVMMR